LKVHGFRQVISSSIRIYSYFLACTEGPRSHFLTAAASPRDGSDTPQEQPARWKLIASLVAVATGAALLLTYGSDGIQVNHGACMPCLGSYALKPSVCASLTASKISGWFQSAHQHVTKHNHTPDFVLSVTKGLRFRMSVCSIQRQCRT
jgi:hypothetical protein